METGLTADEAGKAAEKIIKESTGASPGTEVSNQIHTAIVDRIAQGQFDNGEFLVPGGFIADEVEYTFRLRVGVDPAVKGEPVTYWVGI